MKYPHIEHIKQRADKRKKAFYTQLKMLCSLYVSTDTISEFRVKADLENCSKWLAFCFSAYYWIINSGILSTLFKQIAILAILCEIISVSMCITIESIHSFGGYGPAIVCGIVGGAILTCITYFAINDLIVCKVKNILYDAKHYSWDWHDKQA